MAKEPSQFICEYRTLFEDVANTVPNIRPSDDVYYSSMDYGKILSNMCGFLEGYLEYRNSNNPNPEWDVLKSTQGFYNGMFKDMTLSSPYRHQMTLSDMKTINETFCTGTAKLIAVMESVSEAYSDEESQTLINMTRNQYAKLAKVYGDDMSLYLWLANDGNKISARKTAPVDKRVAFRRLDTPVMHRIDQYQ